MRFRTVAITAITTLALAGGYVAADAYDVVPGLLTTRPVVVEPEPYPQVEGAPAPVTPVLGDAAPVPLGEESVARAAAAVTAFAGQDGAGPRPSVVIVDLATGQTVAELAPTQLGPPASSVKVLTGAAALSALGPDATLPTTAVLDGDRVVLVGGGDLLLTAGDPQPGAVGHASLRDLADQTAEALIARGITEVTLGVDSTLFPGDGSPLWAALDYTYVIRMRSLAIDAGVVDGEYPDQDNAIVAAEAFAAALTAAGITVTAPPEHAEAPDGAEELGRIESAPLELVVARMMKISDNSIAEALGRLVSIARGGDGTQESAGPAVMAELTDLGLGTTGQVLFDTSGLASENLVSARLLVDTVMLALTQPELASMTWSYPVSFLDGTLNWRIVDAAGQVRAKTGTLNVTASLSGIVQTAGGSDLAFSVVTAGIEPGSAYHSRLAIDALMTELAALP